MNLFFRKYEAKCIKNEAKETLIILHGLFGISDNWVGFARHFSKDRDIIIPDLRNHGQSPQDDSFELNDLVDDLHLLIKSNNIISPVILGHSLGGRIAMRYALLYSQHISKLIVLDMSLRSVRKKAEHIAIINLMTHFPIDKMHSLSQIKEYLLSKGINARLMKIIIKNIRKTESGFEWKVYFKPLIALFDKESEPIATEDMIYQGQSLFIRGRNSDYVLDTDIPLIKKHFTESRIISIEGASHWVHADNPIEFIKTVDEFI
ncbi:MAG: alpha/beta fold hydrolase [Bacteroidales bacterium]|nr:alpha/beta fold hydrolase [Bacteroidales bacterium]